ncbi:MAG TPA: TIM barrel protein [Chitinophagaceae bacterium]|nr:TIM barrel protein [Chitinophagaceae bacterium]
MERRKFIRNSFLTGAASITVGHPVAIGSVAEKKKETPLTENKPFNLDYAFHAGMFKNNAGEDFLDQIKWAYDQGFRSIEDNGMMARPAELQKKIGDLLAKLGMRMGVFVITSDSWHWKTSLTTGKQEWIDKMMKDCREAIEVAKRVNAKWMTVVPGNYERSLSHDMQTANVITALRKGAEILAPHGLIMVLEALSDNPDLFLRGTHQTYMICKAVNSPACKFLFDMYHMQRNEGNIIANIDKTWDETPYFQIGDNPGRKEPGTGEMNYQNIFKHIYNKGYKGILGMEHGNAKPGKEGEMELIKAYREADSFK